ncbi:GNAT family N-acetyltransferase [Pinirhizobacter sp.]|jgi:GNAT superfamily N-acetyltransferase|uniref:GNAT family N-acetyltransferase n=1 Tax=Pinirhizobacter sp. TaxID=2950432 RepID=UPI002F42EA59
MATSTHLVRRGCVRDAAEIAACMQSLGYGTTSEAIAIHLAHFKESPRDIVLVCAEISSLTGVASAHAIPLFHQAGELVRITALSVRQGRERQGIGRYLVRAVEHWALARGASRIEVTSGNHREGAHQFYRAMGYGIEARRFTKQL